MKNKSDKTKGNNKYPEDSNLKKHNSNSEVIRNSAETLDDSISFSTQKASNSIGLQDV